eukprot:CAMPEP_0203671376 /NCGR_PEP_ID=MMETSP0090-20130426/7179_1 /ASSEMBLY_ACC=CAM_ASM_001088 /TAXON_ID=426623 /ORGANISM="Chaetoceros affinis, Strain CCMP159" /LENGTH=304 /DNA_ID=CAMNT_0050536437 /DNA_START=94 /DNA_END=1008 /DNA_ORIENTATION=+
MVKNKAIAIAIAIAIYLQLCICVAEAFNFNSNSPASSTCIVKNRTFFCERRQISTRARPLMMNFFSSFSSSSSSSSPKRKNKEIYNIPGSGWTSPSWNWGYASGTGHDCALLCRRKYSTEQKRQELIHDLLHPKPFKFEKGAVVDDTTCTCTVPIEEVDGTLRNPPFEEVKLILGLTIQRGRWDGTDVGGVYNEVLTFMAQAERYESEDEERNAKTFVRDMGDRFHCIANNAFVNSGDGGDGGDGGKGNDDRGKNKEGGTSNLGSSVETIMKQLPVDYCHDYDIMRRICTGLVLRQLGFIELGL